MLPFCFEEHSFNHAVFIIDHLGHKMSAVNHQYRNLMVSSNESFQNRNLFYEMKVCPLNNIPLF